MGKETLVLQLEVPNWKVTFGSDGNALVLPGSWFRTLAVAQPWALFAKNSIDTDEVWHFEVPASQRKPIWVKRCDYFQIALPMQEADTRRSEGWSAALTGNDIWTGGMRDSRP